MITFMRRTEKAHRLFRQEESERERAAFSPREIYATGMTVEDYLSHGKINFSMEMIEPHLAYIGVEDYTVQMNSLDEDRRRLIHILSTLIIKKPAIFLKIPVCDISDQTREKIVGLVTVFESDKDEIDIITKDKYLIKMLSKGEKDHKCEKLFPVEFNLQVNPYELMKHFLGEKLIIFIALLLIVFVTTFISYTDSELKQLDSIDVNISSNLILLDNSHTNCDFNNQVYNVDNTSCEADYYNYEDFKQLISLDNVQSIFFDDSQRIQTLDEDIANGEKLVVSVPIIAQQLSEYFENVPCTNDNALPANISCEDYSEDTSLISLITKDNISALDRNLEYDPEISPSAIIIQTTDIGATAEELASLKPGVKVLTEQSIDKYNKQNHIKFYVKSFVGAAIILFIFHYAVAYALGQRNISFANQAYYYMYLTMDQRNTTIAYYLSQFILYAVFICLIGAISHNIVEHQYSLYLGIISATWNCLLSLYFTEKSGTYNF